VIPSNGGGPTIDSTRDRNEHNSSLIRANKLVQKLETEVLCRGATFQEIDSDDPRRLALDWITNDDEMSLDLDAKNLNQRYILALLAFSLNWWAWRGDQDGNTESIYANEGNSAWLSNEDECSWYNVTCMGGTVTSLQLNNFSLMGGLPPEISRLPFLAGIQLKGNLLHGVSVNSHFHPCISMIMLDFSSSLLLHRRSRQNCGSFLF